MCLEEIGLRAQNLLTILGSIVNTIEEPIWSCYGSLSVDFDHLQQPRLSPNFF